MKGTAKEFDLEVNSEIDERYHLKKSTILACKFLLSGRKNLAHGPLLLLRTTWGEQVCKNKSTFKK